MSHTLSAEIKSFADILATGNIDSRGVESFVLSLKESKLLLGEKDLLELGRVYVLLRNHLFIDNYLSLTLRSDNFELVSDNFQDDLDDTLYERDNDTARLNFLYRLILKIDTVEYFRGLIKDVYPQFYVEDVGMYGNFEELLVQIKHSVYVATKRIESGGKLDNFWIREDGIHIPIGYQAKE